MTICVLILVADEWQHYIKDTVAFLPIIFDLEKKGNTKRF